MVRVTDSAGYYRRVNVDALPVLTSSGGIRTRAISEPIRKHWALSSEFSHCSSLNTVESQSVILPDFGRPFLVGRNISLDRFLVPHPGSVRRTFALPRKLRTSFRCFPVRRDRTHKHTARSLQEWLTHSACAMEDSVHTSRPQSSALTLQQALVGELPPNTTTL